mmetsp:Transcript_9321/g.25301  ORF Transcript_9321/g.25301 Transcript_9321/m.25301 type:complete len:95 (+) Transcript_9321:1599-1883(+)
MLRCKFSLRPSVSIGASRMFRDNAVVGSSKIGIVEFHIRTLSRVEKQHKVKEAGPTAIFTAIFTAIHSVASPLPTSLAGAGWQPRRMDWIPSPS